MQDIKVEDILMYMLPCMHNKEENTSGEKFSHFYFEKRAIERSFCMKLVLFIINCSKMFG
jgi:hypothetical protein